jgi:hypothetical protein
LYRYIAATGKQAEALGVLSSSPSSSTNQQQHQRGEKWLKVEGCTAVEIT